MLESPVKKQIIGKLFRIIGDPFFFDLQTPDEIRSVLTSVYLNRSLKSVRLRVWYGNVHTGRAWNDTFNTSGYVARTMARYPQPMLVSFKSSHEGDVMVTNKIVRIDVVETGETLYAHKDFHVVAFSAFANIKESHLGQRMQDALRNAWFRLSGVIAR